MCKGDFAMIQETKIVDNQVQVVLTGNIFVEEAKNIRKNLTALMDNGQTSFLLDLSKVDYIECAGMGMLVSIQKRALQNGGSVKIKGVHGRVKELNRFTEVFELL
jgi:anti-sigma B factor antagonist